jgi:hypothetical protein
MIIALFQSPKHLDLIVKRLSSILLQVTSYA